MNSVLSQDFGEEFEVIVVDSSSDNTPEIIEKNYPTVRLIKLNSKTDQGKARNIGVSYALGEFIFFIDSDCVAQDGWMKNMLRGFNIGFHVVGGPVLNGNQNRVVSWAGYFFEFNDLLPYRPQGQVEHVASCNSCYKKEVLLECGGFPSGLKFAVEDILYNWFLSRRAVKIYNDPSVLVAHFHRENFLSYIKHEYKLARGTIHFLRNTTTAGWWLTEYPFFAFFIIPLLPLIKFLRINSHILRFNPSLYIKKPLILPLIVLGLSAWFLGFSQELYFGENVKCMKGVISHTGV